MSLSRQKRNAWLWFILNLVIAQGLVAQTNNEVVSNGQPEVTRTDLLGDPLPKHALLRLGTKRFQHPSGPAQILLSQDESVVFTIDSEWLIAWHATNGKQLWKKGTNWSRRIRVSAAGYGIKPMAILPDTGELVTPSSEIGAILFWNVETGKFKSLKVDANIPPKCISASPDGKLLAVGSSKSLIVCDRTGKTLYEKLNPKSPLAQLVNDGDRMKFGGDYSYAKFTPDGKLLALVNSTDPNTIQFFEAESGNAIRKIECSDRVVRMAFSADSKQIAVTERDIAARLYDVATGKRQWEFTIIPKNDGESYTSDIAFRPDGKQIAVGAPIGSDYWIRTLDAKTGKETATLKGSAWKPWTLQYSSNSRVLYSSGWDGVVRRWNTDSNQQLAVPNAVRASSICRFSPDGKHVAFSDDTHKIHLTDIKTGKTTATFSEKDFDWGQIAFSPDGQSLAAGGQSGDELHLLIWNIESKNKIQHWTWPKGRDTHCNFEALCYSKNGQRIAAAIFRQSAAYVWDLKSGEQITKVNHKSVYGLDIDNEGKTIITAGWDKHIRVWNTDTNQQIQSLLVTAEKGDKDTRMYGVALSNDESTIATIDMTNSIRIFDRDLKSIRVIRDAGWFTYGAIEFSHNDFWIGVGSGRGAELFDVESGKRIWTVEEHDEYIYNVDFSSNGQMFLSGGTDGVCYVWDLTPEDLVPPISESLLDKTFYSHLFSSEPEIIFRGYQAFLRSPKTGLKCLTARIERQLEQEVDQTKLAKLIIALGATNPKRVARASQELLELGPHSYNQLSNAAAAEGISESKRKRIETLQQRIAYLFRLQVKLLTQLDASPGKQQSKNALEKLRALGMKP